jgi:hypothetical protein
MTTMRHAPRLAIAALLVTTAGLASACHKNAATNDSTATSGTPAAATDSTATSGTPTATAPSTAMPTDTGMAKADTTHRDTTKRDTTAGKKRP